MPFIAVTRALLEGRTAAGATFPVAGGHLRAVKKPVDELSVMTLV
jgi:hypothetical protein